MLTEHFLAASSAPPNLSASSAQSAQLKDAGIFLHTHQPQPALRTTLKKSRALANCVVASATHVYAAQDGKAAVHVYSRVKGTHEATLAFPAKIRSLALAAQDSVLALGLEDGSLMLWEFSSGRQTQTAQLHLQAVTSLCADAASNFLVSGSADSTVLVWALADLLSLSSSPLDAHEQIQPRHTLTAHRGGITALAIGHAHLPRNILATAAADKTIILWDVFSGAQLRIYLVPSPPSALSFDPADRALYAAYPDGRVQVLDLLADKTTSALSPGTATTPIQPPPSTILPAASTSPDPALCLSVSHDGTTLLTGHTSGTIRAWSVADRRFAGAVAEYPSAPITTISFLPVTGLPGEHRPHPATFIKPKPHEAFSGRSGALTGSYSLHTPLGRERLSQRVPRAPTNTLSEFEQALQADGIPAALLTSSLAFPVDAGGDGAAGEAQTAGTSSSAGDASDLETLRAQNKHLMNLLAAAQEDKNTWFKTVREMHAEGGGGGGGGGGDKADAAGVSNGAKAKTKTKAGKSL